MKALLIAASLLFFGCATRANVGVSDRTVPKDSASTCSSLCDSIGLALDSVVVMADNVGCVCRAAPTAPMTSGTSAASGGMAAIMLQAQAQAAQEADDDRRRRQRK